MSEKKTKKIIENLGENEPWCALYVCKLQRNEGA
jgi:hypothetical protein